MIHELTENMLMEGGMDSERAHDLAMETHPVGANYDPEVIRQFPEQFSDPQRQYWGISK